MREQFFSKQLHLLWCAGILIVGAFLSLPLRTLSASHAPFQSGNPAQVAAVPISEEHHHHLVLENPFIRAYEVEVPPHESTLFHRHDQDYIYIVFGDADITNAVE